MLRIWTKDSISECNTHAEFKIMLHYWLSKSGYYKTAHLMGGADYHTTSGYNTMRNSSISKTPTHTVYYENGSYARQGYNPICSKHIDSLNNSISLLTNKV